MAGDRYCFQHMGVQALKNSDNLMSLLLICNLALEEIWKEVMLEIFALFRFWIVVDVTPKEAETEVAG